jgi:hypothetical protein
MSPMFLPRRNGMLQAPRFANALAAAQSKRGAVGGPPLPPAPAVFGTGPLVSLSIVANDNYARFQRCADEDSGHFTQWGPPGQHITDLKVFLGLIMARATLDVPGESTEGEVAFNFFKMMEEADGVGRYGRSTASTVWAYKKRFKLFNRQNQIDDIVGIKTMRLIDLHLDSL